MRLLLDTHTFLWWIEDAPSLGRLAREAIDVPGNPVFVSAATAWEIAIKQSKGTLEAPSGDISFWIAQEGFVELDVTVAHGSAAGALPLHHRDPFDRMLVAQAQTERMALVTSDVKLAAYDVEIVAAGR